MSENLQRLHNNYTASDEKSKRHTCSSGRVNEIQRVIRFYRNAIVWNRRAQLFVPIEFVNSVELHTVLNFEYIVVDR